MAQIMDARRPIVQEDKESDLEKIQKALSLAQSAFGIAADVQGLRESSYNMKLKKQQEIAANEAKIKQDLIDKRTASGIKTPGQLTDLRLTGLVDSEAPDAIPIQVQDGEEVKTYRLGKPQPKPVAITPYQERQLSIDERRVAAHIEANRIAAEGRSSAAKEKKEKAANALTVAEKAIDNKFAKTYEAYAIGGGREKIEGAINKLRSLQGQIGDSDNVSGPVVGNTPRIIKSIFNPSAINIQEQSDVISAENLKEILGAQFTEKDRINFQNLNYNPSLPEALNKERLEQRAQFLENKLNALDEAVAYYETSEGGSMRGFKSTKKQELETQKTKAPALFNDMSDQQLDVLLRALQGGG